MGVTLNERAAVSKLPDIGYSAPLTLHTDTCNIERCDLENKLRSLGWRFMRHGGRHDIWTDRELEEAIPRHREISERLAKSIIRRARGPSR